MSRDLTVTYYGHVFDASGYGQAARAYIHALHAVGVSLSVVDLMNHGRQVRDELVERLLNRPVAADFHVFHGVPPQWARLAVRLPNAVGMTVWETDTLPSQWRSILRHVMDVWLPCEFNVETFRRELGVSVFRLPHPIVDRHIGDERDGIDRLINTSPSDFVFYSIFEWQDRKGPHDLLRAFMTAFAGENGSVLVLKVNPGAAAAATAAVSEARKQTGSSARITIAAQTWSDGLIEKLHARGDCYVSLHRGEGWGYPLFDAASRGKPVIATGFSGPLDYLSQGNAKLVPYSLTSVQQPYVYYSPEMHWAQPDVGTAARLIQEVYADPATARRDAESLAVTIKREYSLERIGSLAKDRLASLLEQRSALQVHVDRGDRRRPAPPPVPIPGEWYDADYFERGLKSNWRGGYTWSAFSGLFRDTAQFLMDLFPEAGTFLDVGCAKGFLVRCLREAGKECWGIDHSPWAVAQADTSAKPFIIEASAEDAVFDRQVDVLVVLDLLSHLTEEQALEFLRRSRTWTGSAIVASIASFESADEEARFRPKESRDRTHVTMRTRAWWHERFLAAGWRQDALHRLGAGRCQDHALPRRMQWRMYSYAPR